MATTPDRAFGVSFLLPSPRMSQRNSWHHHLSCLLPVNAVLAVVGFGSLAAYSRLMDPAGYGEYVLALTSQMLGQWVCYSWLLMSVARFIPRAQQAASVAHLLSTAYPIAGLISLLCLLSALLFGLAGSAENLHGNLIQATLAYSAIRGLVLLGLEIHRVRLDIPRYSLLESLQAVTGLILGAWLVARSGGRPEAAFTGMAIANLIVLGLDLPFLLREVRFKNYCRPMVAELWSYGAPMAISLAVGLGIANLDRYLLALFHGREAVAVYGATSALAERPLSIAFVWVGSAATSLSFNAMESANPDQARHTMERAARTLILLTLPMAAGLAALAEPLTGFMLGPAFHEESAGLMPLICIVGILKGFSEHFFAHFFQLRGRTGVLSVTLLMTLAASLVFNLQLLPRLGTPGAPISATLAYTLGILLQMGFALAHFRINFPGGDLFKATVSCGLMFALVQNLPISATPMGLSLGVAAGVISYSFMAFALNIANIRVSLMDKFRGEQLHG